MGLPRPFLQYFNEILNHSVYVQDRMMTVRSVMRYKDLGPLHLAAQDNDYSQVEELLNKGEDVNLQVLDGSTALHLAAENNNLKVIKLLIKRNANPNLKMLGGLTPLHVAVFRRNLEISLLLLRNGANVNLADDNQWIPLHIAAYNGFSLEVVQELITSGTRLNARIENGLNALHLAIKSNHLDVIRLLIEKGINVNAIDKYCWAPMHYAVVSGSETIINVLLENNALVDIEAVSFITPLHIAVKFNNLKIVKLLLEKGADVNATNDDLCNCLHLAAHGGHNNVATFLLAHGAELDDKHLALAVQKGHIGIVKTLMNHGANINAEMGRAVSFIHMAVLNNDISMVKFIVENGGYFDFNVKKGDTPLDIADALLGRFEVTAFLKRIKRFYRAIKNNKSSVVEECLAEDVPVDCRSVQYKSALMYAAWKGHVGIVKVLLKKGANVNITDDNNMSALHYAVKFRHVAVVYTLLGHGAVFDVCSKLNKKTPLNFATENKNVEIKNVLQLVGRMFRNVKNGNPEVLKELIEMKNKKPLDFIAVSNARNASTHTLVEVGYRNGHKDIADSLKQVIQ